MKTDPTDNWNADEIDPSGGYDPTDDHWAVVDREADVNDQRS